MKLYKQLHQALLLLNFLLFFSLNSTESEFTSLVGTLEHDYGLYLIALFKTILGITTIIGAFGLFITTCFTFRYWPDYYKRIFFGIFILSTIIAQTFFNVFDVPSNDKLVYTMGSVYKKHLKKQ